MTTTPLPTESRPEKPAACNSPQPVPEVAICPSSPPRRLKGKIAANDLLKYVSANLGLTPSSLTRLMKQTQAIRHKDTFDHGATAMAWYARGEGFQSGMELLGHAGATGGYETFIGFNKDQRRGVVVLSSQQGGLSPKTIGWLLLKGVHVSQEIAIGLSAGTNVVGIGVALDFDAKTRTLRITKVIPNSPASESGLSPGLVVQRIDGVATTDKSLTECVGRIRGKPGTKIRLELFDPKQNATNLVELTRRRIQM